MYIFTVDFNDFSLKWSELRNFVALRNERPTFGTKFETFQ